MCINYRRLNAVTVKDATSLALPEETRHKLADAKVFCQLLNESFRSTVFEPSAARRILYGCWIGIPRVGETGGARLSFAPLASNAARPPRDTGHRPRLRARARAAAGPLGPAPRLHCRRAAGARPVLRRRVRCRRLSPATRGLRCRRRRPRGPGRDRDDLCHRQHHHVSQGQQGESQHLRPRPARRHPGVRTRLRLRRWGRRPRVRASTGRPNRLQPEVGQWAAGPCKRWSSAALS
ncbi:MAG: hypothetical protein BJ554DRAFT_6688 [Olpidium bornovanus]|uniref:Uncharacterized protein n=1 Tax=Olpidium bornovanus TaxID=278681 RepID=A0A8H7ZY74_9FUNG|nr:MAG: hypothetical protein BJ554DRAFT_6688 [Olpidium bornovanus]